jgi:hypothetical protein
MARQKIRRRARRARPTVRRVPAATTVAARAEAKQSLGASGGLMIGGARDTSETAADRMADRVMSAPPGASLIHRKCAKCEAEDEKKQAGGIARAKPATGTAPIASGAHAAPAAPATAKAVASIGAGRPLATAERAFFEPRFGMDFSSVRVHDGPSADRASRRLHARAFALGSDIAFARGAYDPSADSGRRLMAHELAHVVQDGEGPARRMLHRDLAIEPPNPEAEPRELTEEELQAAQEYNERRFEDPFTICIIRDVLGIDKYPAVVDRDFIDATLRWQAVHNLNQDGKFGPAATLRLVRELQAEGEPRLARLVRQDNYVRVHDVLGPNFHGAAGAPGNPGLAFQWDVRFTTSLRNGFIVQRIDNVWNQNPAAAAGVVVPTARYWEAWAVDGNGRVTPVMANTSNDTWRRPRRLGTTGNWRMRARLYTVLNLPAVFGVGNVPDAGALQSTLAHPGADVLGLPEGFMPIQLGDEAGRTIAGRWDFADPVPGNRFHRRA